MVRQGWMEDEEPVLDENRAVTVNGRQTSRRRRLRLAALTLVLLALLAMCLQYFSFDEQLVSDGHYVSQGMITAFKYSGLFISVLLISSAVFTLFHGRKGKWQSFVAIQTIVLSICWLLFSIMGVLHMHECCRKRYSHLMSVSALFVISTGLILIVSIGQGLILVSMNSASQRRFDRNAEQTEMRQLNDTLVAAT